MRVTYRLFAMDLDGTVIGDDLIISQRVKDAVKQAIDAGVLVTLATGRMFQGTKRFAEQLGIAQPVICYQGAMIRHSVTDDLWFHNPVPMDLAKHAIEIADHQGKCVIAFVDDQCYVSQERPESRFYHHHSGVEPRAVGDLGAWLPESPTKVLIITDQAETDATVAFYSERFAGQLIVARSFRLFTELTNIGVTKGHAMARLCERLGMESKDIAAIGDNLNDLDMIQFAGFGIAVGNGAEAVRAAADAVCATQANDGVAEAIERYILPTSAHVVAADH
jgi:Cof subfamily protein (haloacid dehalogenase superfamily)